MRRFRLFTAVIIAVMILLMSVSAAAITVEQTQAVMPVIDVYLYEDGTELSEVDVSEIHAELDGVPLAVVSLGPSDQPIFYCYMLDISGSMPASYFTAAKNAVLEQWDSLRPQDTLALITFGNNVEIRLEGGETREQVVAVLDSLYATDSNTKLYDAMAALIDHVSSVDNTRRVAVVISDGIESADAGISREELEEHLRRGGVSVNAMCIDLPELDVAEFTDFVHLTGGELFTYGPENAGQVLNELVDRLDGGWHLVLSAGTNRADMSTRELTIDFGGETVSTTVSLDRSTPDDIQPQALSAEYLPETGQIKIAFSEAMKDAVTAHCYELTDARGRAVALTDGQLAYDEAGRFVLISFAQPPEEGEYELVVRGLTDASSEENQMKTFRDYVFVASGVEAASAPGDALQQSQPQSQPQPLPGGAVTDDEKTDLTPLYLLGGFALLALVLIVALAVVLKKKKDGKPQKPKKEKQDKGKNENVKQTARFMFLNDEDKK